MGLIDQARRDWKSITSDKDRGFAVEMLLTAPDGETATITNLHTKHHAAIDFSSGAPMKVNSKQAHISFSESQASDSNPLYVLRNADGEVYLQNHRVTVKDSTGLDKVYVIDQWWQNETLGVIVCILGDYA
jgi:hypothetical protein